MSDADTATSSKPARRRAQKIAKPLQEFLTTESGSSVVLLAATLVALVWANSPLADSYDDLWHLKLTIELGGIGISEDLQHWVNDVLMVFFFYVVGLEIRREMAMGELQNPKTAAVPIVAAIAGMIVPALLFLAINSGTEYAPGWGIVMATDIAFVLGVLALVGPGCPPQLRVFLLTLAIVDDIGAILVIAVFYSEALNLVALAVAAGALAVAVAMSRARVGRGEAWFAIGLVLWAALYEAGIHPTIGGVMLGLLTPVFTPRRSDVERAQWLTDVLLRKPTGPRARRAMRGVGSAVSPNQRLQEAVHPWSSYVIIPIFALANAGVALAPDALERAFTTSLAIGIVVGLVAGKAIGISLSTLGTVRLGRGNLPSGVGERHIAGAATLAGIGFTVSLFIAELAYDDEALVDVAKIGVLAASLTAAIVGFTMLRVLARRSPSGNGANDVE